MHIGEHSYPGIRRPKSPETAVGSARVTLAGSAASRAYEAEARQSRLTRRAHTLPGKPDICGAELEQKDRLGHGYALPVILRLFARLSTKPTDAAATFSHQHRAQPSLAEPYGVGHRHLGFESSDPDPRPASATEGTGGQAREKCPPTFREAAWPADFRSCAAFRQRLCS